MAHVITSLSSERSACILICVLHSKAFTFHVLSQTYLYTSFYTGLDVSIIIRCLFFF